MRSLRRLLTAALLLLLQTAAFAQTRQLTGTLKNAATGDAIPSATIKVKGRNIQAVSGSDGTFSLTIPTGRVELEISSVGFIGQTFTVTENQTSVDFTLVQGNDQLNEVVVTALGVTKEQRKLGYSVTTVNGDQFSKARETNIANSLAGQVAGLSVRGTNSGPGGTSKLLLRGMPSMSGVTQPLYVINGIPMDNTQRGSAGEWGGSDYGDGINNINPDDVESVTVLKGQAASALYGARATNGVIIITTKNGKKGRKDFTIEYNLNYMAQMAIDMTDFQYEYGQGSLGVKPSTQNDAINTAYSAWGAKLDGSDVIGYDGKTYKYSAQKNNIDFFRTANSLSHNLSLTKSSETGAFRIGMTYQGSDGIVRNSGLDRYSFNLNADQNITDKLSAQVFVQYIDQKNKNITYLSDAPMNVNNVRYLAPNIDQATLAPGYDLVSGNEMVVGGIYSQNPWFVVNKMQNNFDRRRLISSLQLKYQFTKWLYAQARVGYDKSVDNIFKIEPWGTAYRNTTVNGAFASGALQNLDKAELLELNVDGMVGANHNFGDWEVSAMVGGNLRKNEFSLIHNYGSPFIQKDFYSWTNLYNKTSETQFWETEVHSAYYSADFTYKKYLTVGTTGRYDAYSTLPPNSNSIFVPSVYAGFVFSELLNVPDLQYGKLRVSYATANAEFSQAYKTQIYYSLQANGFNGIPLGTYSQSLPNGLLKPYVTSEFEVGAELRLFNGKLNADITYFNKKTKDEIMGATLSRASGYADGYVASGSTKNTGIELLISTRVQSGKFSWKPSLNLTKVESEILHTTETNSNVNLGLARETLGNLITAYVVGKPGPQILGYDYKRDANGAIIVDGSGIPLKTDQLVPLGSVVPNFYGGLNNEFFYGNFSLSVLIDYNYGNKMISSTSRVATSAGLTKETLVGRTGGIVVDGVTEAGAKNTVNVSAETYYPNLSSRITAMHVKDGDFIKLRQVILSYQLPSAFVQKSRIFKGAALSLTARNLFIIWKKAENVDPEESFGSEIRYYGIEGRNLPPTRSIGANLKVNF